MSINIDVHGDLDEQFNCINVCEDDFTINVPKVGSFYPLVQLIKTKFPTQKVTIMCSPCDADNSKLLISNKNRFLFIINNGIVDDVFVNDEKVDVSSYCIVVGNNPELNNDFILDLFCIYDHVMIYDWQENPSLLQKNQSGAEYGYPSGSYIRHPFYRNIVEIDEGLSYCNYSGSTIYVNIMTRDNICGGCECCHSPCDSFETLKQHGYDCHENDFNLVRYTILGVHY